MTTPLYNPDTKEIRGGFKGPFRTGNHGQAGCVFDSRGHLLADCGSLRACYEHAQTVCAILNEYCEMKEFMRERGEAAHSEPITNLSGFFDLCVHTTGHGFSADDLLDAREIAKELEAEASKVGELQKNCTTLIKQRTERSEG